MIVLGSGADFGEEAAPSKQARRKARERQTRSLFIRITRTPSQTLNGHTREPEPHRGVGPRRVSTEHPGALTDRFRFAAAAGLFSLVRRVYQDPMLVAFSYCSLPKTRWY